MSVSFPAFKLKKNAPLTLLQVLFSRFASPHVNIRLDSRPVSASVALLDTEPSDRALLMATGNKVGFNLQDQTQKHTSGPVIQSYCRKCKEDTAISHVWKDECVLSSSLNHNKNIILMNFSHQRR